MRGLVREGIVKVIPNGIGEELLSMALPDPSSGSYGLFLGRLATDHKGLDLLLEGLQNMVAMSGVANAVIVLAGPDCRGNAAALAGMSQRLGLEGNLRFEGPVYGTDKLRLIAGARFFIHTSRWEGLPLGVLEAMALKRPVLITPETNLAPFVTEAGAGWVTSGSPREIGHALLQAFSISNDALDQIGHRAQKLVREEFSWSAIAKNMSSLYEAVLGDRVE
jgi:glycosyltransferase involved in cell wall biosynthesis